MFASLHTAKIATRAVGSRRPASIGNLSRLLPLFSTALAVHRQRKALANLDDSALCDLGLSRDAALAEANRPLWDVPRHWQQ